MSNAAAEEASLEADVRSRGLSGIHPERKRPDGRVVFTFTVPRHLASKEVSSIGMVQLTSDEEIMATKRAANNPASMAQHLAIQALAELNGTPVSVGDGSSDTAWGKLDPKQRALMIMAYGHLHTPEDSDIKDFLRSQAVTVG